MTSRLASSVKFYGAIVGITLALSGVTFASRALQTGTEPEGLKPHAVATLTTVAPGGEVTFTLEGFTPNSKLVIGDGDPLMRLVMFSDSEMSDAEGRYTRTTRIPDFSELGPLAIPFQDEQGNRATVTVVVDGRAPRPFIFFPEYERQGEVLLYRFHGIGWTQGRKKTVSLIDDRIAEKLTLAAEDLCELTPCEREDAAELVVQIPTTVLPGDHRVEISEEGSELHYSFSLTIPLDGDTKNLKVKPIISLVSPPMGTRDLPSILIRGVHWGPYKQRRSVRAWLLNPQAVDERVELAVDRNYDDDELFVRLEFTDEARALPPRDYLIYVLTNKGQEATIPFYLVAKPDLSGTLAPTLAVTPSRVAVGQYFLLTGAGFPPRSGGFVRLDGMPLGGNALADDRGAFDNVGYVVPQYLEKRDKIHILAPGRHTIEVDSGKGVFARANFEIGSSDGDTTKKKIEEQERTRKEELEKDTKEKQQKEKELKEQEEKEKKVKKEEERLQKERERLEQKQRDDDLTKKEAERLQKVKKEEQKKERQLEAIDKKVDRLQKEKETLEQEILFDTTVGKTCLVDRAITFQPGCVSPMVSYQPHRPAFGLPCDENLPLVWQEGCVERIKPVYVPETAGKDCRTDTAITFQPGCKPVPPPAEKPSLQPPRKPTVEQCNPFLPDYIQKGCMKS